MSQCPNNINCERSQSSVTFLSGTIMESRHLNKIVDPPTVCPFIIRDDFQVNMYLRPCQCNCYTATVNFYEEIADNTIVLVDNSPEFDYLETVTQSSYSYLSSSPYVTVNYLPPPYDFSPPCTDDFINFDDNTCTNYNITVTHSMTPAQCINLEPIDYIQDYYTFQYSLYYNDNRHLDIFVTFLLDAMVIASNDLNYIAVLIHIHSLLCSVCYLFYNYSIGAISNTKEDAEVLKGLWEGRYYYNELHDTHVVKRSKLIDMIP